jgi:hypothetical protein
VEKKLKKKRMRPIHILPTQQYVRLRKQIQKTFDFAYVVCQSVPCLKLQMSLIKKDVIKSLPAPDYFGKSNALDAISQQVKEYKSELCRHTILSSFSYFEAYVTDVVRALIDFHGGAEEFHARSVRNVRRIINNQSEKHIGAKRVLQKNKINNNFNIQDATKILEMQNYVFPSEMLYPLGVKFLSQKIGNLRASEIPSFVQDAFGMQISDLLIEKFHEVREIRNKIAHGNSVELIIKDVAKMNSTLRDFALEIDKYLMANFFITESQRARSF